MTTTEEPTELSSVSRKAKHVEQDTHIEEMPKTFDSNHPSPDDLENFLPWACKQYGVVSRIIVVKKILPTYVASSSRTSIYDDKKSVIRQKQHLSTTKTSLLTQKERSIMNVTKLEEKLSIYSSDTVVVYAELSNETLINFKLLDNAIVPYKVIQVLALIVKFYRYLQNITINRGLNKKTLHEISKLLSISNITEVTLDSTFVREANYYVLLDSPNSLKNLSLSRCHLNDSVIQLIASRLSHPTPASKTLMLLNLSSNRISDIGAGYLAEALRSNRKLAYLNLSDNMITSDGAREILDVLHPFKLNSKEYKEYLTNYNKYILNALRNKTALRLSLSKTPVEIVKSRKSVDLSDRNRGKAASEFCNKFNGSFCNYDTIFLNNERYCKGNMTLNYLNLNYNDIKIDFLKKLLDVLAYQDINCIWAGLIGIVMVKIEGNPLPMQCVEYEKIDAYFERKLYKIDCNKTKTKLKFRVQSSH